LVMVAAALYANSSALLSESLDNLGDALTYGISLYAVLRSMRYSTALRLCPLSYGTD
jgi:Co/Zn/Cd efflux system component